MGELINYTIKEGISTIMKSSAQIIISSIEHSYKKELAAKKFEYYVLLGDQKFEYDKLLQYKKLEHEKLLQYTKFEHDKLLEDKKFEHNKLLEDERFKNARILNKEIIDNTHIARLNEQRDYFLCRKAEMNYDYFLKHSWPLISPPEMLLHTLQTNSNPYQIPLLIIFAGYTQEIAPIIESIINKLDEILTSIDGYLKNQEQRTILYTRGWRSDEEFKHLNGQAVILNIFEILKGYPTLVLEPIYNKHFSKIFVNASFWSLGSKDPLIKKKVFEISYPDKSNSYENESALVSKMTAGLATVLVSISDMYNFLEYNRMPQIRHLIEYKEIFDNLLASEYNRILPEKEIFLAWCLLNNGNNLIVMPKVGASFLSEIAGLKNVENQLWITEAFNDILNNNIPFRLLIKNPSTYDRLYNELLKNYDLLSFLYEQARKCCLDENSDVIQAWKFFCNRYTFV